MSKKTLVAKTQKVIIVHTIIFSVIWVFLGYCFAGEVVLAIEKALDAHEEHQVVSPEEIPPVKSFQREVPSSRKQEEVPLPEGFDVLLEEGFPPDNEEALMEEAGEKRMDFEEGEDLGEGRTSGILINTSESTGKVSGEAKIDLLQLKDMDIIDVLNLISQKSDLNIIAGKDVSGKVSIYLKDVKLKDALRIILDSNKLAYNIEDGIIRVMPAHEFEARYGYRFGGKIQTRVLHLVYANARDVVSVLEQIKSTSGKIISDAQSNTLVLMDSPETLAIMEQLIEEIDVPVETKFFALTYATAKDMADKISEVLTENIGQLKYDDRSNKIVITDTSMKVKKIAKIIQAFDVKEKQVLIEAKILQVRLSDQHKFGVDWQALVPEYHSMDLLSDFDILSSSDKRGRMNLGTISDDNYTVLLEALETIGDSNILSSPSIIALNNQEAKILVGSTEPYVTTTTTTPSSGPTTTSESVNFIDVGVKLYVTPTVHRDNFITLKIKPEVSSVTSTITTSNNNTIPVVDTSEAETTVMVKDGVTIVIGGLIKEEKIESRNKVPLLGDIPVLGYAFQNRDTLVRKTEIIIFLTPRIITGDVPGAKESDLDFISSLP